MAISDMYAEMNSLMRHDLRLATGVRQARISARRIKKQLDMINEKFDDLVVFINNTEEQDL
jgi:hypothetical protein